MMLLHETFIKFDNLLRDIEWHLIRTKKNTADFRKRSCENVERHENGSES